MIVHFKALIARFIAKFLQFIIIRFKLGKAKTAPGLIALKIDHKFLFHYHKKIKTKILVTGTNGKTTTTNLIGQLLKADNRQFLVNDSGSNLERGVASSLLGITKNINTVLWESDEAAFVNICNQIHPTHIIITNLFRDQLDRYGEINTLFQKWSKCLSQLPPLTLFLNSDDPNLAYLGQTLEQHKIIFFSLKYNSKIQTLKHSADAVFCPLCHKKLNYSNIIYSHLGDYSCSCHFKKPNPNIVASKIETNPDHSLFSISKTNFRFPLIGLYNIYNALAAYSLAQSLNISHHTIISTFENFVPIQGRQEIIKFKDRYLQLWLAKNPTSFDQVFNTLTLLNQRLTLCIALNDGIADGTDISWIWDIDFEHFKPYVKKIIVTGDRAYDLALRLKYAQFNKSNIVIEPNKKLAIFTLINQTDKNLYIIPTYTALWQIRSIISRF